MPQVSKHATKARLSVASFFHALPFITVLEFRKDRLREERRVQRFLDDLAELRNCATRQLISRLTEFARGMGKGTGAWHYTFLSIFDLVSYA